MIYIFDYEVVAYDWVVVAKNIETKSYIVLHNNNNAVATFMTTKPLLCGFNNKHYDQYIHKAVLMGASPEEIKELSDFIVIDRRNGWEHPLMRECHIHFEQFDLKDDCQKELSLKAIEAHLGMDIRETTVPFDINRPLTNSELQELVFYCKHDVDATHELLKLRKDYLKTKQNLGLRAGIPVEKSLYSTNAKLTALMLRAERREWDDGRNYVYPDNLDTSVIPSPILDFFDTIHDESIPDEVLFDTSLEINLGGMACKYSWGGAHGSLTGYHEKATENRVIQNRDVMSLYPSLIEIYNYLSRNVPDPELFYSIKRDRLQAKHKGDKQTAKDLKLPLNTVSGAQENKFNDLYDPLPTRSMRISGQLFMTVLALRLLKACETIRLINFNTDGLMYSVDVSELNIVDEIARAWEAETKFELEVDDIREVWVKDVNNLLLVKTDGKVKTVGSYLNYGISEKGAWSINNNMVIVKKAITEYFIHGTPVEDTINRCNNILDFQLVAKAGSKYSGAYYFINGERVQVQKCNRVYATKDERFGTLIKVHAETGKDVKIGGLPDHCLVDNDNVLPIEAVDRDWYINLARKQINDFLGIKPPKNNTRKINSLIKKLNTLLKEI